MKIVEPSGGLSRSDVDCRNHIKPGDLIVYDSIDSTVYYGTARGRCIRAYRDYIVVKLNVVEDTVNRWDIKSVNGLPYRYGGRDQKKPRRKHGGKR